MRTDNLISNGVGFSSDEDTIHVQPKSQRSSPNTTATSSRGRAMDSLSGSSMQEAASDASVISDFNLSSPVLQNATIASIDGLSSSTSSSTDDKAPSQAFDGRGRNSRRASEEAPAELSRESSPLSELSRTPSPPAIYPTAAASDKSSSPNTKRGPSIVSTRPARLSQKPLTISATGKGETSDIKLPSTSQSKTANESGAASTRSLRQRKTYKLECTHTDTCTCRIHAAHSSVRYHYSKHPDAKDGMPGFGRYQHFSEYALANQEWPESALRESIKAEKKWRQRGGRFGQS